MVSEKKGRPAPLIRKTTPQYIAKVGAGWSGVKQGGNRERERDDVEKGRDSGESFPQYW